MTGLCKTIGLIGDIHGEDEYLVAVLTFLQKENVSLICTAGDIVDGRGKVSTCCRLLRENNVWAVAGNHDRWFLAGQMTNLFGEQNTHDLTEDDRTFLKGLPRTREIETVAGLALLCHGIGEDDMSRFRPFDEGYSLETNDRLQELSRSRRYKYLLCGHTHHRMVRKYGKPLFINGGTLKFDQEPGFAIVDFEGKEVHFYDVSEAGIEPADKVSFA